MSITIRPATFGDVPWLLSELRAFAAFYEAADLYPSDDEAAEKIRLMVEYGVLLIAEDDGHPLGFIGGYLGRHPDNDALPVLAEKFWWVTPAARGTSAGARLLAAFTDVARAQHALLQMSLLPQSPVKPDMLERRGFRLAEYAFVKDCRERVGVTT